MASGPGPHPQSWPRSTLLAQLYDWEHDEFQADVQLYSALGRRTEGPALELACGTGRVLAGLARDGLEVVGVDHSPEMLGRARRRLGSFGSRVNLLHGDITQDFPPGPFGLIVFALDAFGLIAEARQQLAVLQRVRANLAPLGVAALDLVHAMPLADQPEGIPVLQRTGDDREIAAHVTKWLVRSFYPATQALELFSLYDITWSDGSVARVTDQTRLRYFSRYEVELLLAAAGLEIEGIYGDYGLGPFEDGSERMVIVTRPGRDLGGLID